MGINPDFRDLFYELNAAEARYLVIGAHAVIYYAVPRYTKDVDIWIEPSPDNARRVHEALGRFGAPMESLTVEDLQTPGTVFQIGVEPNRVDVLTSVEGLDFAQAWGKRETSSYGELPISILGLEDLIACKRRAGRPQDLLDVSWLERARSRREA